VGGAGGASLEDRCSCHQRSAAWLFLPQDCMGRTAAHYAASSNQPGCIEALAACEQQGPAGADGARGGGRWAVAGGGAAQAAYDTTAGWVACLLCLVRQWLMCPGGPNLREVGGLAPAASFHCSLLAGSPVTDRFCRQHTLP
jgi:hypothetical protein